MSKIEIFSKLRTSLSSYLLDNCGILEVASYNNLYSDEDLMLLIKVNASKKDHYQQLYSAEIDDRLTSEQKAKCHKYLDAMIDLVKD